MTASVGSNNSQEFMQSSILRKFSWNVCNRSVERACHCPSIEAAVILKCKLDKLPGRLKTQVRKTKVPEDGICKYGIRKYEYTRVENASTENVFHPCEVWICNGEKRKYSNLKSILKSLRFSSLAFSVDPLSVGLDQFTCTVQDRCYTHEIGLMLDSCAEGPGFKNRRRDAVE